MNLIGVCNHWGCIAGGIIFAMLSIYELSNMYRCHADSIIDTIASPPKLYLARTLALLTVGTATDVLVMLLENRGRVITRDMFLDQVWGIDYYGDDRVVNVHLANLRKKLKGDYIETVRGVGYKFHKAT